MNLSLSKRSKVSESPKSSRARGLGRQRHLAQEPASTYTLRTTVEWRSVLPRAVILSFMLAAAGLVAARAEMPDTLRVRALIDGQSLLVISQNSILWEHLLAARPGRHEDQNEPTYLNTYAWLPEWPDEEDRLPGESLPLAARVTFSNTPISIELLDARSKVQILQQPESGNGFRLVIDFDDWERASSAWYEILLTGVSLQPKIELKAQRINQSLVLSWPASAIGHYLENASGIGEGVTWTPVATAPVLIGDEQVVIVHIGNGARLFRLIKP
jgi:hypothetical protein